jgi:hypothetical protein
MTGRRALVFGGLTGVALASAGYWFYGSSSQNSLIFRPLSGRWAYDSTFGTDRLTGTCAGLPPAQRSAAGPSVLSTAADGTTFRLDIDGQTVLFHRLGLSPDFETGRRSFPVETAGGPGLGEVWFEAHVDTTSAITGATKWTVDGCDAAYPFTLTLETAYEPDGVVPQPGHWQVTATPALCPTGPGDLSLAFAGPMALGLDAVASLTLAPHLDAPIVVARTGPLTWSGSGSLSGTVAGAPQVFAGVLHVTFVEATRAVATFVGAATLCGVTSSLTMTWVGP